MTRLSVSWIAGVLAPITMGATASGGSAPDARPPSLCAATEKVVFGCAQEHKVISLCAKASANGRGRTRLRYLYGTQGRTELEVSQAARPDAFTSGITALSGGGIDYVRVRNGEFAYVLYTGMTPGWSQDGWIVEAHGAAISHHICKRVATGPEVWGPVYAAKLPEAPDAATFSPPEWIGAGPRRAAH